MNKLQQRPNALSDAELIEEFLDNLGERSRKQVRWCLTKFSTFTDIGAMIEAGQGEANRVVMFYRAKLRDQGLGPSTINQRLWSIRAFIRFLRQIGKVNWALDVPNLKAEKYRDMAGPGIERINKMLAMAKSSPRDYAILRLLFPLGLRREEIVRLDLNDLDLEGGRIKITGKGRLKPKFFTLDNGVNLALRDWIEVRGNWIGPLFVNADKCHKQGRLTGRSIDRIVKKYGGTELSPHRLRHSVGTILAEASNGNVYLVQAGLRHKDPKTTQAYIDNLEDLFDQAIKLLSSKIE